MLTKNLETYLGKSYQHVFNGLVDYVNFKIEENLTLLMDENDYVVEIQTFAKNSQNLNSEEILMNSLCFILKKLQL